MKSTVTTGYRCRWCSRTSSTAQGMSAHERSAHPVEYEKAQGNESMLPLRGGALRKKMAEEFADETAKPVEEPTKDAVLGVDVAAELENWIAKIGTQIELYQRKIDELRYYEREIEDLRVQRQKITGWLHEITARRSEQGKATFPDQNVHEQKLAV